MVFNRFYGTISLLNNRSDIDMINFKRPLNVLSFSLDKPLILNNVELRAGINIIKKEKDLYNIYDSQAISGNFRKPYATFYQDEMPFLVYSIFKKKLHYEDEDTPEIPFHEHT